MGQVIYSTPYTFTTLAGYASGISTDGTGSDARFAGPFGVATDIAGNIYVADRFDFTIRKVTPAGAVTTLVGLAGSAGSADGIGSDARFSSPEGVAADNIGNIYVADAGNATIRKVTPAGVVTTLAGVAGTAGTNDGMGNIARFNSPAGVAADTFGNIYVADTGNSTIRKLAPIGTNWLVTTLAGVPGSPGSTDGTNSAARFSGPSGLASDSSGSLYAADSGNQTIRKLTPTGTNWVVTTVTGLAGVTGSADGTNGAARFDQPNGVAADSAGNVYVADTSNGTIRKVTPAGTNWVVTTIAGLAGQLGLADGSNSTARFLYAYAVAVDSATNVIVADDERIRKVMPAGTNWVVTTLAGLREQFGFADGTGSSAQFRYAYGLAADSATNVYVADTTNDIIRKVTPTGVVTTLAGLGLTVGSVDGTNGDARFDYPEGVAVDGAGNIYVADTLNYTIRKLTPMGTNWVVTTIAGLAGNVGKSDGVDAVARFYNPAGLAVDKATNIYVADEMNDTIRRVSPTGADWMVTTIAGLAGNPGSADGTNSTARFSLPECVAVDGAGNIYVAEGGNNPIRKIAPVGTNWVVTTPFGERGYADGTNRAARFDFPTGLAADSGDNLYVADGNAVR